MTYESYRMVFYAAAIACGACFLVTALLFFLFRIPRIISDISGRTAKKGIQEIRERNELSGDKAYKSSTVNRQRGKVTDRIGADGRPIPAGKAFSTGVTTEKISTEKLIGGQETEVLYTGGQETEVLNSFNGNETEILYAASGNETEVLYENSMENGNLAGFVIIEREITFIHTEERVVV